MCTSSLADPYSIQNTRKLNENPVVCQIAMGELFRVALSIVMVDMFCICTVQYCSHMRLLSI